MAVGQGGIVCAGLDFEADDGRQELRRDLL
jgi:hypothetical protein